MDRLPVTDGIANAMTHPRLKSNNTAPYQTTPTTDVTSSAKPGFHLIDASGPSSPSSRIEQTFTQFGTDWSGSPRNTVDVAWACTSGPDITSSPLVEVGKTSLST